MKFFNKKIIARLEKLADYLSENRMFLDTSSYKVGKWMEEYDKISKFHPREFEYYCRTHNYDKNHDFTCTIYDRRDIRFGRRLSTKQLNTLRKMGFSLFQDNFSWEK